MWYKYISIQRCWTSYFSLVSTDLSLGFYNQPWNVSHMILWWIGFKWQKTGRMARAQFWAVFCVCVWGGGRFSFFFCGKTEIMRKQPRSSLLINFPFLSSFPECYQSSHLHNQQVIAFSIANNSLLVSVLYLICKLLPWQHFFFFRGKPNTTDIYRSNLNNVSRGNWYFPSKSGNTLELTKH